MAEEPEEELTESVPLALDEAMGDIDETSANFREGVVSDPIAIDPVLRIPRTGPQSRSEKLEQEREHQREVLHDYITVFLEGFPQIKRESELEALIEWLNEFKEDLND